MDPEPWLPPLQNSLLVENPPVDDESVLDMAAALVARMPPLHSSNSNTANSRLKFSTWGFRDDDDGDDYHTL